MIGLGLTCLSNIKTRSNLLWDSAGVYLRTSTISSLYKRFKASKMLKIHLFADDTNVLHSHKCLKSLERKMNQELTKLQDWFIANKLTINIKKI